MIHTYETHEEDPIRKCFFSIRATRSTTRRCAAARSSCSRRAARSATSLRPRWASSRATTLSGCTTMARATGRASRRACTTPPAAPVHRLHVRRDRGRDPVPLDAPTHHDPGAQGGVPLHRQGRGAPPRHLPALLQKVMPALSDEDKAHDQAAPRGFVFLSACTSRARTSGSCRDVRAGAPPARGYRARGGARRADPGRAARQLAPGGAQAQGFIEPYGIEFPALPEVGIDGRTVAFDPEDLIPVF